MQVINNNPEIPVFQDGNTYTIDFGKIKKNNPASITFLIKDAKHKNHIVYCSVCTSVQYTQLENEILFTIQYAAQSLGNIGGKQVDEILQTGEKITFKLTGEVVK